MKSKLLFSHSYYYRFDAKQWDNQQPYPPLATIYAAANMRESGYEVALFDTNLAHGPEEIIPMLETEKPNHLVLYDDGFNYLTKMCLTNMREAAFKMSKMGKEKGCHVIVSSSDSTDHYKKYLAEGADFIILGEGEETLKELVEFLDEGKTNFENVPGIAFEKEGEIVKTPKRPVIRDLDTLPQAAWDLINIEEYKSIWIQGNGYFSLNIATTRGCPFKCNWCAKPIYGNRYNTRSPKRVADEIEYLMKHYQPDHFWMCDDIFGLKPKWVQEFNEEVQRRGLEFSYKIQSRVDLLLQEDNIEALAESGLKEVWVGAESGSQKILDAMDKGTQLEQIYEATRILKSKGVRVAFFLQFGYLGEEKEDINATIKMLLDLMPDDIGISVSYPLPGTGFYETVKADMINKSNWTDSDDLDMMFQGTYSTQYYKKLHRYVHKVFRRKQGFQSWGKLFTQPSKKRLRSALSVCYYVPAAMKDSFQLKRLESAK
jgi:anaerobic magnesium-protoporphyrin IX monomethyl ester cyclase